MARLADPGLAQRRRREILDAAEICFRKRGFHQATMQEICAEARISPGALYRYFDSKADIIAAIAEEKSREAEAVFKLARQTGGFADALVAVAETFLSRLEEDDGHGTLKADILGEAARDPALARRLADIDAAGLANLSESIREAQTTGEIDAALDPMEAAETLIGAFEGIGIRCGLRRGGDSATLLRQFRTLIERYLAPRSRDTTYARTAAKASS